MIQKSSIVVCINDANFPKTEFSDINWPKKNEMYVARKLQQFDDGDTYIL